MPTTKRKTVAPDRAWSVPAKTWADAIGRYVAFLQVPSWRASVRRAHQEVGLVAAEATLLNEQMLAALDRAVGPRLRSARPTSEHLAELWAKRGRATPRAERCPSRLQPHFQRAFLLNEAGYTCAYCRRTAWGVYEERSRGEGPRTLRFEIDHHTTRGRLSEPSQFEPANLVAACRSCNVIKGEMLPHRFLAELKSLGEAVVSTRPSRRQR